MIRAEYVTCNPPAGPLMVVYAQGSSRTRVETVAGQLTQQGIQAQASQGSVDDPNGPQVPILRIKLDSDTTEAGRTAAQQIRLLTKPKLPATARKFFVTLLVCDCGSISHRWEVHFLSGFEAEHPIEFALGVKTAMEALPIRPFEQMLMEGNSNPLLDLLENTLHTLGLYVIEFDITSQPEPPPCTHSC